MTAAATTESGIYSQEQFTHITPNVDITKFAMQSVYKALSCTINFGYSFKTGVLQSKLYHSIPC